MFSKNNINYCIDVEGKKTMDTRRIVIRAYVYFLLCCMNILKDHLNIFFLLKCIFFQIKCQNMLIFQLQQNTDAYI